MAGDDPDAVDMAAMPRQRRRREKKLMSMDEVNEKFPLTKYKTWRSARAQEGLPTAGGINAATSRPASVKNMPRISEDEDKEITPRSPTAIIEKITPSEPSTPVVTQNSKAVNSSDKQPTTAVTETTTILKTTTNEDEEVDTSDQIQTAIPAEHLPDPGDTCAICIDVLEDDDDIRGLTCGHAFHASCVDPWLTSRRACCPLCKADYYTPKPRPEGEAEELRRRNPREEMPPSFSFMGSRGRGPPLAIFGRQIMGGSLNPTSRLDNINRRAQEQSQATPGTFTPEVSETQQSSWRSRMNLPRLPAMSRIRNGPTNESGQQPTSPSQLEAGQNTTTVR
jgi:hypothetical protein